MDTNYLHQLDPENPYSEVGSISYSPPTPHPSPQATSIEPTQQFTQPNLFFRPPPTPPNRYNRPHISYTFIQPPVYDGSSDPSLWLKEYELIANANYWSDGLKVKRLIGSLIGAPKLYFLSAIEYNPNLSWPEFRDGLKLRFTSTDENNSSIASLYYRKQGADETFNEYWYSKLQLIETKRPNLPIVDKKHLLLVGLLPDLYNKVMEQLIVRPTENLEELRDIAKQLSDLTTPGHLPANYYKRNQPKAEECVYMASAYEFNNNDKWNFGQNERPIQNFRNKASRTNANKATHRNVSCFVCDEIGHYSYDCPIKRQFNWNSKNDLPQNF
jgi:hypothetical protein